MLAVASPTIASRGRLGKPTGKDGQTSEQPLLDVVEQVITPGDSVPQGVETGRHVLRTAGEETERMIESREKVPRREDVRPCCSKLDR